MSLEALEAWGKRAYRPAQTSASGVFPASHEGVKPARQNKGMTESFAPMNPGKSTPRFLAALWGALLLIGVAYSRLRRQPAAAPTPAAPAHETAST